jgi:ABC-type multidrug transport system fused ATPase/permease subunit
VKAGWLAIGRAYLRPLIMATVLTLAEVALDLARPWPLKIVVDNGLGHEPLTGWLSPLAQLTPVALAGVGAIATVVIVGATAAVGYQSGALIGVCAERIGADMRRSCMSTMLRLSMRYHDRNRSGELVNRLVSDVNRVVDAVVVWFSTVIPEGIALVCMLVLLLLIDPLLGLTGIAVTPILAVIIKRRRRRVREAQRLARQQSGALAAHSTDLLRNVRSVQAFHRFEDAEGSFRTRNVSALGSSVSALLLEARLRPATDIVLAIGTAGVLFLGAARVSGGHLTLGTLLVVMSYLSGLYAPVRSLTRLNNTLTRGSASRDRLSEVLDSPETVPERPDAVEAPRLHQALTFEHVSFGYRSETPVLTDLELSVPVGRTVCVVGASGAGKSTMLSLLLRLYDPNDGAIRIDGVDIRDCSLASLRERVAFVPQDPWLLDGTILDNIIFGRRDIDVENVTTVARQCLVDDFVRRLPDGYATEVGENGVLLSGGERRRLAIARAVLRPADILLLDEPTSGLDATSEAVVTAALRRAARDRTVVMVSHRLNLARDADLVVVLAGGRLVEQGDPNDLLRLPDSAFARMCALQQQGQQARRWSTEPVDSPLTVTERPGVSDLPVIPSAIALERR